MSDEMCPHCEHSWESHHVTWMGGHQRCHCGCMWSEPKPPEPPPSELRVIAREEWSEFDSHRSPSGAGSFGWDKIQEPPGSVLWEGVRRLIARSKGLKDYDLNDSTSTPSGPLYLTVHHSWSGYSEYTITSTWDEITVEWGDFTAHYDHMSFFFRAVFEADVSYDRDARWDLETDPKYGDIAKGLR